MKKMFIVSKVGGSRLGYFSCKDTAQAYVENLAKYLNVQAQVLSFQHTVPENTPEGGYL
jgi:hypothetical protein